MVLTRPVTKTIISTTAFGQPVYDWIIANTPTAWTNLTLKNGWIANGGSLPQYRKIGDTVYLRGSTNGGAVSSVMATLPVGFRPVTGNHDFICFQYPNTVDWATLSITATTGDISLSGKTVAQYVSLTQIYFSVLPA